MRAVPFSGDPVPGFLHDRRACGSGCPLMRAFLSSDLSLQQSGVLWPSVTRDSFPMTGLDEELARLLSAWAAGKPTIRRLWVFGSRARGDHRSDSDLDVAFLIDRLPEHERQHFIDHVRPAWREELAALVNLSVHFCSYYDGRVQEAIEASSVLVYERDFD